MKKIEDNEGFVHIRKKSDVNKVLVVADGGTVKEENYEKGKLEQQWYKEKDNIEGYFVLINDKTKQALTASSSSALIAKGMSLMYVNIR